MRPVALPAGARRVEDADEEIFLLYSQLQASGSLHEVESELGGLGSVDSRKNELLVRIDVTPPGRGISKNATSPSKASGMHPRKMDREVQRLQELVEISLFQDTTALRSRQGDTGSVLWRASVHLARLLLSQLRFPSECPFLPSAALATCHVLELGAGTGLLSIALAPHVARYTVTDIPALLRLIRKNLAHNLTPAVLARVVADDLDWVQLHNTPAHTRSAFLSVCAPAPTAEAVPDSLPRKGARRKVSSASADPEPATVHVGLVLVVDCIYNPALIAPLLTTIAHVAGFNPVLIVLELRASDVAREFLEGWLALSGSWEVWSVPLLGPQFAMWVGKRTTE